MRTMPWVCYYPTTMSIWDMADTAFACWTLLDGMPYFGNPINPPRCQPVENVLSKHQNPPFLGHVRRYSVTHHWRTCVAEKGQCRQFVYGHRWHFYSLKPQWHGHVFAHSLKSVFETKLTAQFSGQRGTFLTSAIIELWANFITKTEWANESHLYIKKCKWIIVALVGM